MSIAAVSANSFLQSSGASLLSGPRQVKEQFTLPDQTPLPKQVSGDGPQYAGNGSHVLRGGPTQNVLAHHPHPRLHRHDADGAQLNQIA